MSLRDLTARSSQAKSDVSDEAIRRGRDIYRKIVDDDDDAEFRKFKSLATASANMERPVEITQSNSRTFGRVKRLATAFTTIFGR
jgi:hypothetical protein